MIRQLLVRGFQSMYIQHRYKNLFILRKPSNNMSCMITVHKLFHCINCVLHLRANIKDVQHYYQIIGRARQAVPAVALYPVYQLIDYPPLVAAVRVINPVMLIAKIIIQLISLHSLWNCQIVHKLILMSFLCLYFVDNISL